VCQRKHVSSKENDRTELAGFPERQLEGDFIDEIK
jgi:hypothetical protein